jgi:hypothetical protein
MNPLIANDIARFTVNGTYGGRVVANILDMAVDVGGSLFTRADILRDQAEQIVSAWVDHINPRLVLNYVATSVSWLDLNSLNGSTGNTVVGFGTDMPDAGNSTAGPAPGNVALRVLRNTVAVRGQRQGRMYLAGMSENETGVGSPNNVEAANVTAWNTQLGLFLNAINQDSISNGLDYDSFLSVLHTRVNKVNPADPSTWVLVYEGASIVTSLSLDPTVGSQRRRLRG